MIGADAMVKCLEEEGVRSVFGYPGVAICPFYNSILQTINSIRISTSTFEICLNILLSFRTLDKKL